ncbi:hypothetical protein [Methylomonas sp. AM2-LC]|uniref:hypothetical protein n=1 Tax=Methylomonas sp. AM2-LC TaxID=3153301 RepID=UPI0032670276
MSKFSTIEIPPNWRVIYRFTDMKTNTLKFQELPVFGVMCVEESSEVKAITPIGLISCNFAFIGDDGRVYSCTKIRKEFNSIQAWKDFLSDRIS